MTLIHDIRERENIMWMGGSLCHAILSWWNFEHSRRSQKTFCGYLYIREMFFLLYCVLLCTLSLFLDFIIILFIVRSIVIWIWRVRMRQLISLIRNCEKKGLTITSTLSYHKIKSCLIHGNDLQHNFWYISSCKILLRL